jgi:hypothetical protein
MASTKRPKPAVESFAEVARRYCEWAEGELGEPHNELRRARLLLAELHVAAVRLPALGSRGDREATKMSHEEWSGFFGKFAGLPLNGYWDVFNPLEETEPIFNSLADDLADIYRDVKAGLSLFDEQHCAEAAWEWRFNFQIHWGQHLVGAQRALHEYLSEEDL